MFSSSRTNRSSVSQGAMSSSARNSRPANPKNDFEVSEVNLEASAGEEENVLVDILKCDVCLELPKGKQVKICEMGHHFCSTCHSQMNTCGICRGILLESRNFVVEKLVTKLGAILGNPNYGKPTTEPPVKLCKGLFNCLHGCSCRMPAFQVLPHLRAKHSGYLCENICSNPYTGMFSFDYSVTFKQSKKYLWSVFVSDMGLFTFEITFSDWNFFCWVRILGNEEISSLFQHQIVLRIPRKDSNSVFEFSVTDCPLSCYRDSSALCRTQGRGLSVKGKDLLEHNEDGCKMSVYIFIWKKTDKGTRRSELMNLGSCLPKKQVFFETNRRTYRNRRRNLRKRNLKKSERDFNSISDSMGSLIIL